MSSTYVIDTYGESKAASEKAALAQVKHWLTWLGHEPTEITDPRENWQLGDLRLEDGSTVESKCQGIGRYPLNFVDVIHDVTHTIGRDLNGRAELERVLDLEPGTLATIPWTDARQRRGVLTGMLHCKLTPSKVARWTVYVSPYDTSGPLLWAYTPDELLDGVREALLDEQLAKEIGKVEKGTYGVKVARPAIQMRRMGDRWVPAA